MNPALVVLVIVIILIGIGTIILSLLETVVAFKPSDTGIIDCLVYRSILGVTIIEKEIKGIQSARLGTKENVDGQPLAYRIEFQTVAQVTPLIIPYSRDRHRETQRMVAGINQFIQTPDTGKMVLKMGINLGGVIVGIAIALVGIGAIFLI